MVVVMARSPLLVDLRANFRALHYIIFQLPNASALRLQLFPYNGHIAPSFFDSLITTATISACYVVKGAQQKFYDNVAMQ